MYYRIYFVSTNPKKNLHFNHLGRLAHVPKIEFYVQINKKPNKYVHRTLLNFKTSVLPYLNYYLGLEFLVFNTSD